MKERTALPRFEVIWTIVCYLLFVHSPADVSIVQLMYPVSDALAVKRTDFVREIIDLKDE